MAPKVPFTKFQWIILTVGLVVGLFLTGSFLDIHEEPPPSAPDLNQGDQAVMAKPLEQWTIKDYEDFYENSLKEVLEEIVGVGEVKVMVNLESSEEKVYQENIRTGTQITNENDKQGGTRTIDDKTREEDLVLLSDGSGEAPVLVKTLKPKIRGVVVVANGAENMQIKAWIFDVVNRALDVPAHRISIVPMKKK
jgi:stage III sporulation protein AG